MIRGAFAGDPSKQRQWLIEQMEEMQKHFSSLIPDDAKFHYDSVKVEYLKGTTETYISVDTQLYIKMVESGRGVTKHFWKRVITLSVRVRGI